ncbi:MAG: hypothetical protein ABIJ86_10315 [Spirochaetota bacterium]
MAGLRLAAFRLHLRLHLRLCLAVALLMPMGIATAQDRDILLRAELRIDLEQPPSVLAFEGVTEPGYVPALTDQAAATAVLAEGLWLFYGMIHGFDYVYTPSDRARAIADLFEIQPRTSIPASSPAFSVAVVRLNGRVLMADVAYLVPVPQRAILASWDSISYRSAQGRGEASAWDRDLIPGPDAGDLPFQVLARRAAIIDASREALRDYLRGLEFNKPREVRGSFAFADQPRLVRSGGSWIATVRLRVGVDEIIPYGGY